MYIFFCFCVVMNESTVMALPKQVKLSLPSPVIPFDAIALEVSEFVSDDVVTSMILPYVEQRNNCYMLRIGNPYIGEWEIYIFNTKLEVIDCLLQMNRFSLIAILSNLEDYIEVDIVKDSCVIRKTDQHERYIHPFTKNCIRVYDTWADDSKQLLNQEQIHRIVDTDHLNDFVNKFEINSVVIVNDGTRNAPEMTAESLHETIQQLCRYKIEIDVSQIRNFKGTADVYLNPNLGPNQSPRVPIRCLPTIECLPKNVHDGVRILNFYHYGKFDPTTDEEIFLSFDNDGNDDPRIERFYYGYNRIPRDAIDV